MSSSQPRPLRGRSFSSPCERPAGTGQLAWPAACADCGIRARSASTRSIGARIPPALASLGVRR
eukprot:12332963-Alexandrium_andersonii.AAC.1